MCFQRNRADLQFAVLAAIRSIVRGGLTILSSPTFHSDGIVDWTRLYDSSASKLLELNVMG